MSFTINETGITTPSASEVRELVVAFWREAYGTGAQTASETPDGLMIDMITVLLHMSWEASVKLYNDGFFSTAGLDQLILILEPFGVVQIPAEPSTVTLVHVASADVTVPAGHLVQVGGSGGTFSTDASAGTSAGASQLFTVLYIENVFALAWGGISLDIDYGPGNVDVDLTPTVGRTPIEVAGDVLAVLNADPNFTDEATGYVAGTDDTGRARLLLVGKNNAPTSVSITGSTTWATHEANAVTSAATCTVDGATPGPVGEVDTILTAVTNLLDSFNYVAAVEGRLDETAAEMRARWLDTLSAGGSATGRAVRAALLKVEGMISVGIDENEGETDFTGSGGLPPHSFRPVVLQSPVGGPYTPEQDAEVAEAIYPHKPLGVQSYGSTVVTVQGDLGPRDIGFDRVEALDLWITVTITKGEGFPTAGDPAESLKQAIAAYYQTGPGALGKGDDFEHATVGGPVVTTVPQIKGIAVTSGSVPAGDPAPVEDGSDEVVTDGQILIASADRVVVNLV